MPRTFLGEIIQGLDAMGDSAVANDLQFGLRCYPDHHKLLYPGRHGKRWEELFTAGLETWLRQHTTTIRRVGTVPRVATNTHGYPPYVEGGNRKVDVFAELNNQQTVWLEFKTVYSEHLADGVGGSRVFSGEGAVSYAWKKAFTDPNDKDIRHDYRKLTALERSDADWVAILLLCFDREHLPLSLANLHAAGLPLEVDDWTPIHQQPNGDLVQDRYEPRASRGFQERLYLWFKDV